MHATVLPIRGGTTSQPARARQDAWDILAATLPDTAIHRLALTQGFVITIAQAAALGVERNDARRLIYRGRWTAPRRGVLCVLPRSSDPLALSGNRAEIAACAFALTLPHSVISHDSAALLHGLPVFRIPTRPVVTTMRCNAGGDPSGRAQSAQLWPDDVTTWYGAPVTAVARSIVDVARTTGGFGGQMAADAALREQLVTRDALAAVVRRATRWPGVRTAREVVEIATPQAESPLESMVRFALHHGGLPLPEPQVWVDTPGGSFRVDGLWRGRRVALEADGMEKYDSIGAIRDEKRRQEYLEQAGYRVVRVTWDDVVRQLGPTLARMRRVLAR